MNIKKTNFHKIEFYCKNSGKEYFSVIRKILISDELPASSNLKSARGIAKVLGLKSVERRKFEKVELGDKSETEIEDKVSLLKAD